MNTTVRFYRTPQYDSKKKPKNRPIVRLSAQPRDRFQGRRIGSSFPIVPHETSPIRDVSNHPLQGILGYGDDNRQRYLEEELDDAVVFDVNGRMVANFREAGRIARNVLTYLCDYVDEGMTTDHLDEVAYEKFVGLGAFPSLLGYKMFPKSISTNLNEVVCGGVPDYRKLVNGDVLTISLGCFKDGAHCDVSSTVIVGEKNIIDDVGKELLQRSRKLITTSKQALEIAIKTCNDGSCTSSIGSSIHEISDALGYQPSRAVFGFGVGSPNYQTLPKVNLFRTNQDFKLKSGMILSLGPALVEGHFAVSQWDNTFTHSTIDFGLSASFKETILITPGNVEILTRPYDS